MNPQPLGPFEVETYADQGGASQFEAVVQQTVDYAAESKRLEFEINRWEFHQRMAKLFVASGCFSDIKGGNPEQLLAQAMVKIELGGSMGFGAAESMKGIDLIQGKPAIAAELRAARMAAAGYSWNILEVSDVRAAIEVFYRGKSKGKIEWTYAEAERMGLTGKDNWKKSRQDMLWARCITRAQRRLAPHVLSINILSREEAIDIEEVVDSTIAAKTREKTAELAERLKAATAVQDPAEEIV
jgi:hypothetical protein